MVNKRQFCGSIFLASYLGLTGQQPRGVGKGPNSPSVAPPTLHPAQHWMIHKYTKDGILYRNEIEKLKIKKGIGSDYTFELNDLFENDGEIAADMTTFYKGIEILGCTVRLVYDKKKGGKLIEEDLPVFPSVLVKEVPGRTITPDQAIAAAVAYRPKKHGMPYLGDSLIEQPFLVWYASFTESKNPTGIEWDYTRTYHGARLAYHVPFDGRSVLIDAQSGAPIDAFSTAKR